MTQSLPERLSPLSIHIEHLDVMPGGYFRPAAFLKLTSDIRKSGFLLAMPAEDLKNFLFLLSFLTPNGDCAPTLMQLASAMHVSQAKARSRMQRLTVLRWQDRPLVTASKHGNELEAFMPAPGLIPMSEEHMPTAPHPSGTPFTAAAREAVIAFSRKRYARPRAQVEREIAELNGWELPETPEPPEPPQEAEPPQSSPAGLPTESPDAPNVFNAPAGALLQQKPAASLRRRLENCGLTREQAEKLLTTYNRERIERQLAWLPFRNAKNPAGYLLSAIERNYAEPLALRKHLAVQAVAAEDMAVEQAAAEQGGTEQIAAEQPLMEPPPPEVTGANRDNTLSTDGLSADNSSRHG